MAVLQLSSQSICRGAISLVAILAVFLSLCGLAVTDERAPGGLLRIGTLESLTSGDKDKKEAGALDTLQDFIKTETRLDNDIVRQKDWRQLAEKMAKGQLDLGVFQGHEFAWAQEKYDRLTPLALAVNVYRYPVVYVMARQDHAAADFAGLRGQSLSEPTGACGHVRLFLDRQCQAGGKKFDEVFSRITTPDNVEDALDDVVDGDVQVAVVERAGLEAFKRRKPARFGRLKEVARSQPFPPGIVAYYAGGLDRRTLDNLRNGLVGANQKERGKTLLTLFRLSSFDVVPDDFDRVVKETLKAYPPPESVASK